MDTTVLMKKVQDTSTYDFTGERTPVKRYTFYIGTNGPFVEDVPTRPTFDPTEIDRRIAALVAHLAPR
jgi:hypothetical protein